MLIDTAKSPYAKVHPIEQKNIRWLEGFWNNRFNDCADITIPHIFKLFEDNDIFHAVENFRIASGEHEGEFSGTPYGDGDLYKLMEGAMYIVAKRHDKKVDAMLDDYIALIGRAQQPDGYISTKQIIGEMQQNGVSRLGDINDFEVYNFGHLFTAACTHKRITGKDNFMEIALRAAEYLDNMYHEAAAKGEVQTAVCPSHYMGLVELYRTTGNKKYLDLAKLAIDLRDTVKDGTDDNQDRFPLREHDKIVGHAVRSTYLYAGVADLYLETGDKTLKPVLDKVWNNLMTKKIYLNGGCGALYNGVSPYGLFPDDQKIHQAFGYEYQLPNITAYNETCGTLGNIFWTYRMFAIDPQAKYFDLIERSYLNLALAAVSLDGDKYFYENMLRRTKEMDFPLRWPLERAHVLECFCCPTNLSRCIMEALEYTYMVSDDAVWAGLYGASEADFQLKNGAAFTLVQETNYPWNGDIRFTCKNVTADNPFTLKLRVPGWLESGKVTVNGKEITLTAQQAGSYLDLVVEQPSGMDITVRFDMPVRYITAHAKVEEDTNQVAVERGPLLYCIETPDADVESIDDLYLLSNASYHPVDYTIKGTTVVALESEAAVLERSGYQRDALYQPLKVEGMHTVPIRMIPYFAWDNRGFGEMRIWMPILFRF